MPGAESAVILPAKLQQYLLALSHEGGKSKARWFLAQGYHPARYEVLENDLLRLVQGAQSYRTASTEFGVKYIVTGRIQTPKKREVAVLTVWLRSADDERLRFVTARPLKEQDHERA